MKRLKMLAVTLGVVAVTSSVLAIPTLTISDSTTTVTLTSASGLVIYGNPNFDGLWSVVISTGETKPAIGGVANPVFDLNVQATSLGGAVPANNLVIKFSDNGFGPTAGNFQGVLSGHVVSGTGQPVTYNTYYDAGDITGATTTLLTTLGPLPGPGYNGAATGGPVNQALYSISQVLTIGVNAVGTPGGSYSLDASLASVPDGGTTVMLLGAALSGLALLRRKIA
jgi:hypothetical protein